MSARCFAQFRRAFTSYSGPSSPSWPREVPYPGRSYSIVVGITYNFAGQPDKALAGDSAVIPNNPNQCQWTPIERIDAERLDAGLVHKVHSEVFGENARFFKLEF